MTPPTKTATNPPSPPTKPRGLWETTPTTAKPPKPARDERPAKQATTAADPGGTSERPLWVTVVFLLYVLVAVTIPLGSILWATANLGRQPDVYVCIGVWLTLVVVLVVAGIGLVVTKIGQFWQTPTEQKPITRTLFISATSAALLFAAAALSFMEFVEPRPGSGVAEMLLGGIAFLACLVWMAWATFFWLLSRSQDRQSWGNRVYRSLVAGSVLELLVAIPMHLVVRRRTECCAGTFTGTGLGVGLVVMLVALGPSVLILCYRRYQQVYAKKNAAAESPRGQDRLLHTSLIVGIMLAVGLILGIIVTAVNPSRTPPPPPPTTKAPDYSK